MARLGNLWAGLLLLALASGGAGPAGAERAVDIALLPDAGSLGPSSGLLRDDTGPLARPQDASAPGEGSGGGADGRSSGDSSGEVPPWASRLAGARRDILVWMMRLNPDQCTSVTAWPCFNIYAVNATSGELIWFAYSTDITGIKAASVGRRTLYFTTWSGPGLYAVNLATGRVKWNFPVNNWFAYWRKEIDLPPSASFSAAGEGGAGTGFATAAGPRARVYGLRLKGGGELRWEWKAEHQQAVLADVAGPDLDAPPASPNNAAAGGALLAEGVAVAAGTRGAAGVLYVALSLPRNGSSQLVALSLVDGSPLWSAEPRDGAAFARVEMDGPRLLVADTSAGQLLAYDKADGRLLWHRQKPFCATPHPLSRIHAATRRRRHRHHRHLAAGGAAASREEDDREDTMLGCSHSGKGGKGGGSSDSGILLLTEECDSLTTLTAVDTATGKELWSGFDPRHEAHVTTGCSAVGVDGGVAYLGCNCQSEGFADSSSNGVTGSRHRQRHSDGSGSSDAGEGDEEEGDRMVCLYALELLTGRRLWWREVEVGSGAAFDPEAQAWGQAPLFLGGTDPTVVFVAGSTVLAASAGSGKLLWISQLSGGGRVAPWQMPTAVCDGSGGGRSSGGGCVAAGDGGGGGRLLALIPTIRGAGNWTSYYALDPASGSTVWYRDFNGSAQQPPSRSDGGAAPLALGSRVVAETCHRRRCCLRGLNTSTGKVAWRMCLDAVRGTDPTNPRAQFAIWVVTLVTVASIAALILGAALLYINRWAEERALMDAGNSFSGGESGLDYEPLAGARRGGGGGGTDGGAPRLSLFARAGGAATTVLGGPPSPGSLAAAAFEAEGGAAAAAPWAEDARGRGGGGGGGLFRGRERVPPRGRGPPREAAAAVAEGAPPPPAARTGNIAVSWRQDTS